ncbi:MAG TPA: DMT family transporter, partial [Clostridiaceae bacterium]|nr:DMT family transporter [Clostridiaceae bacterium]
PFVAGELGSWRVPSLTSILNLLFLGVFCSALAYVFYLGGIKILGPVLPSSLLNLIPVVTIIAGVVFLNETLSVYQAAGSILIIGSLTILSIYRTRS